jgi:hypothetical protein
MRHISISLVLSALLLVSVCSAQQTSTSDNKRTNSGRDASQIGIYGPVIGGDGTAHFIPLWISPNYLLSSVIFQASGGNIGIGKTSPGAALDVNGSINTTTNYQIGGTAVLKGTPYVYPNGGNLALGFGTGDPTTASSYNVFVGFGTGTSDTSGSGNVFAGALAGAGNTTGSANNFFGVAAGYSNTTGANNTFVGTDSGYWNNSGSFNTFLGSGAGADNTIGGYNVAIGSDAGSANDTGVGNTILGNGAGEANTSGSYNIFIGYAGGIQNTTGSGDIYIGTQGPQSGVEWSAIRIGAGQNSTYIAGIYGDTSPSGVPVYVNQDGLLHAQTSSLRFKEQVRDMGDSTSALMRLRPVTFLYRPEYDKGDRILQYGLIAEEVAKVYPELVAYDSGGQPYSVRYQYLSTMLLNEVQKQYHRAEAEAKVITAQEQKIEDLEQRLSRLESLIPQTVANK